MKSKLTGIIVFGFLLLSCSSSGTSPVSTPVVNTESKQERILKSEGYENIEMKGAAFWGCSEDDSVFASNNFSATKNGYKVEGMVCCGLLFKGCTVRLN